MQYLKKMCILRQIKQGFTGDGKPLSGLVKIEQYGKNIAIEVSIIHFAPTVLGDYYCLLADSYGNTELLPLRGKSMFNILSNMDISLGFCAVVCFVNQMSCAFCCCNNELIAVYFVVCKLLYGRIEHHNKLPL